MSLIEAEDAILIEFAAVICGALRQALAGSTTPWSDWTLEIEPGRGLHSDTGVHLTTVKNLKNETAGEHRRWAEVDTSEVFLDLHVFRTSAHWSSLCEFGESRIVFMM